MMNVTTCGGGTPAGAACSTATDSELDTTNYGDSDDGYSNASNTIYHGAKVTINGTLTAYIIRGYEDLAAGQTTSAELWADDGGAPSRPAAGGLVADTTVTIDQASLPAAVADYEFAVASPKAGLSGTYWIVVRASAGQYRVARDISAVTGTYSSSTDSGATWGAPATSYQFRVKALGCP